MVANKRRWVLGFVVIGLLCLFGLTLSLSWLVPTTTKPPSNVQSIEIIASAPPAPQLTVNNEMQTRYRIDSSQSQARYVVQELLLDTIEGRTVVGTTRTVYGEMVLDRAEPEKSQLGEIVINVQSLTSDSSLRDQRLRADYLQSNDYPEVRFVAEQFTGLPEVIEPGIPYPIQIVGYLTVKATTVRVVWDVTLTLEANQIVGKASTQILMSTFEVGPINLIGWLKTEDVMQLQFDFVALPTDETEIAVVPTSTVEPVEPKSYIGEGVEFHRDIRPILEANCVGCHTTGQIGFSVYPLLTIRDAVNVADDLAAVVQSGYMPPWFAGDAMPPLQHDPSLSDAEIATMVAWAEAGAPVDGALDTSLQVTANSGIEIRQDLVLDMPVAYQSPPDRTDDYRCFILDPRLETQRYITGYEVIPGSVSIVHHVLVFPVPAEAREVAETKSNFDGRPGWECFGGTGLVGLETNTAIAPGWVPGGGANQFPPKTGILMQPGDLLVFQVHYNLEGGAVPDQSSLVLELSEPGAEMIGLQGIGLAAPVEIPCPAAYRHTEPCQREFAIRDSESRDPEAGLLADALLLGCNRTLEDYVNQDASRVVTTCDSTAPISGEVIQVNGHMHRLGTSNRIELNPNTPNAQILLDLPMWDFDWQQNYTFVEPIRIEEGDTLRITCTWDNTRGLHTENNNGAVVKEWQRKFDTLFGIKVAKAHNTVRRQPFQYVTWGEGTRDEMCLSAVIVIPDPDYDDIVLTDQGDADLMITYLGIMWMRWLRNPLLMTTSLGVIIGAIFTLILLYRHYRKAR